jgi:hypothetical protein
VKHGALALALLARSVAFADDERPPMAEPLISETITDIDGTDVGEGEFDATAIGFYRGIGSYGAGELEMEIKLTRRFGVALNLEPSGDNQNAIGGLAVRVGASFGLWHDLRHDFHLQAEATARVFELDFTEGTADPQQSPYRFGFRAGWRRGRLTLRSGAGVAIHGTESVPLWFDFAALGEWGTRDISFAGVELVTDWSVRVPMLVIPEVAIAVRLAGRPLRIGAGLPIGIGYRTSDFSVGGLLRLILEIEGS